VDAGAALPAPLDRPRFHVDCGLVEGAEGDFRMYASGSVRGVAGAGATPAATARDAETLVQVLRYGRFGGLPVTKVLLQPLTGRRHQLRVHMAECGAPIVGDVTYSRAEATAAVDAAAPRMMLHALRLAVDWSALSSSAEMRRVRAAGVTLPEPLDVTAPDPTAAGGDAHVGGMLEWL